jgi:hypothetical protein
MLKKNRAEGELIRTLLSYTIHKYLIYLINKIKNELLNIDPASIFNLQHLKDAE